MRRLWVNLAIGIGLAATSHAPAQVSLSTVVDLALRNDPKIKVAQADLDKARAALAESHDAFVPAVSTTGGYGGSTGVPLSLPVVFSVSAQSLVFNFSQKDYIRAASASVAAATLSLDDARNATAEDATTTYVALDNAQRRREALRAGAGIAARLVQITQDRFDNGADPRIELTRSHRTATQIKLQQLLLDDEIATLSDHLNRLTGVTGTLVTTVTASIPAFSPSFDNVGASLDSPGIRAAETAALAKGFIAHGDARYRLRPQVAFSAGYSRITTVGTDYSDYYPRFANNAYSHNSFDVGFQITVPIFDLVHQARARGTAADATHARFEAANQRMLFAEGRLKLEHAAAELAARAELASLDRDLAQDQLAAIELQLSEAAGASAGPQLTPKDEQNARLQERQRYFDMLASELQLRQAEISLMRQNGQLGSWLHQALPASPSAAATVTTVR